MVKLKRYNSFINESNKKAFLTLDDFRIYFQSIYDEVISVEYNDTSEINKFDVEFLFDSKDTTALLIEEEINHIYENIKIDYPRASILMRIIEDVTDNGRDGLILCKIFLYKANTATDFDGYEPYAHYSSLYRNYTLIK